MSEYLIQSETLQSIADAIREKTGSAEAMNPAQFPEKIAGIETGADVSKVTATAADVLVKHTFVNSEGILVEGTMPEVESYSQIEFSVQNNFYAFTKGYRGIPTTVSVRSETKTVTPTKEEQTVTGTHELSMGTSTQGIWDASGNAFLEAVTVEPIPAEYQDVSGVTAAAEDVRAGKVFVDAEGNEIEGTLKITETEAVENAIWASTSNGNAGSLAGNGIIRYVTFMNHDGTVEYGRKSVLVGEDCVDPVSAGYLDAPTRESTAQYSYTFSGGWATEANGGIDADALKAVAEDRTVYANFVAAVRYYTITFYDSDGATVLAAKSVAYGSVPDYIPAKEGYVFNGWTPEIVDVTGPASYTVVWSEKITFADGTWADIARISEAGKASENFAVGDSKKITVGNTSITLRLIGFDHDTLADGGGKAGITIFAETALSNTTTVPDWQTVSDWMTATIKPQLPSDLQAVIKPVLKACDNPNDTNKVITPEDIEFELFPLSLNEVGITRQGSRVLANSLEYITKLGTTYAYFASKYNSTYCGPYCLPFSGNSTIYGAWYRQYWRYPSDVSGYTQSANLNSSGATWATIKDITTAQPVMFAFCI